MTALLVYYFLFSIIAICFALIVYKFLDVCLDFIQDVIESL